LGGIGIDDLFELQTILKKYTAIRKVTNRLHIGFDDPAETSGTEQEILSEFRRVRDRIGKRFHSYYI